MAFGGANAVSEPKLLPVIHGLLTTTGCGPPPRRPQPMGFAVFSVNEFVAESPQIFQPVLACATDHDLRAGNSAAARCRTSDAAAEIPTAQCSPGPMIWPRNRIADTSPPRNIREIFMARRRGGFSPGDSPDRRRPKFTTSAGVRISKSNMSAPSPDSGQAVAGTTCRPARNGKSRAHQPSPKKPQKKGGRVTAVALNQKQKSRQNFKRAPTWMRQRDCGLS